MNATELQVLGIFRDLFHLEAIDARSDFYELGGDSNLAVTLGLMLEDAFRMEIPLDLLEEVTTVAGVAAWIDNARPESQVA